MKTVLSFFFLLTSIHSASQGMLDKNITLTVSRQKVGDVLEIVSNQANFYFSYHSGIIKRDSLVSFSVTNKPVRQVLSLLFDEQFEFRESGKYIIIRRKPVQLTLVTNKAAVTDKTFTVSGFVLEDLTGSRVRHASIYERSSLASDLTDEAGHFSLKLKSRMRTAAITVSKEFYEDTTVQIQTGQNQQLQITIVPVELPESTITISPEDYLSPDKNEDSTTQAAAPLTDSVKVESTGFGKFMIPARQRIQSINLKKFFTERPFQISLTPGLSTHGKLSPQVVNHFSLNVLGGYTAGTDGVEIGGLFNINKKNVRYFQAAGIINIAGGTVRGFQVAGVNNTVLDSVTGFQAAGVNNFVKGAMSGFQAGGVYNHVSQNVKGIQVAGVANFAARNMKGLQVAGVINYARRLKGVQVGLINIADSSDGFSIGLINIVLKGYHKLSVSTNEVLPFNLQFKSGNSRFYSILHAAISPEVNKKLYGFGYGAGSDLPLNRKKTILINPEILSQYLYMGTWEHLNLLNRLQLNVHIKVARQFSIYAGPAYSVFVSNQEFPVNGYLFNLPKQGYTYTSYSDRVKGWIGFTCGLNFF